MKKNVPAVRSFLMIAVFGLFIAGSVVLGFDPGIKMGRSFTDFALSIVGVFPAAFILIGLFDLWVDKSVVERYLGEGTGFRGYFWAIILASSIMAPLIISLPVAHTLQKKGARLSVILCFVGASTICRIPMNIFEVTFLGIPFSLVRWTVSLPLVVASSIIMEKMFKEYEFQKDEI